jgi:hypothetical protein
VTLSPLYNDKQKVNIGFEFSIVICFLRILYPKKQYGPRENKEKREMLIGESKRPISRFSLSDNKKFLAAGMNSFWGDRPLPTHELKIFSYLDLTTSSTAQFRNFRIQYQ